MLFMTILNSGKDNDFPIKEGIYIYEFAVKKPGHAYVGFIITNDTLAIQRIGYEIFFSKRGIVKVDRGVYKGFIPHKFMEKNDGNIFVEGFRLLCFSSGNFKDRNKLIPDDIYKMISPDFLNITNEERCEILESLSKQ